MGLLTDYLYGADSSSGGGSATSGGLLTRYLSSRKKDSSASTADPGSEGYKKGGKVKKTEKALVHKGERVLTKSQAKKYDKHHKRAGCK